MVIENDISECRLTPTPTTAVVVGDAALASWATDRHRRRGEPPQALRRSDRALCKCKGAFQGLF